jgi:hypothetical protein
MKKLVFVLLWIITQTYLTGQNNSISRHHTIQHLQEFKFRPGRQPEKYEITNYLLQTIAESNQKLRVFTSYTLEGDITVEPVAEASTFVITVKDPILKGDIYYKAFSLRDILIPEFLELTVLVREESGNILQRVPVQYNWISEKQKAFTYNLKDNRARNLTYEIAHAEFFYPPGSLARLKSWTAALESYYQAEGKIADAWKLVENLSYRNPESVILDEFRLCEAEALFGEIRFMPYHRYLFLDEYDPLQLKPASQKLEQRITMLRSGFNHAISYIDSLLYDMAVEERRKGNFNRSRELFSRVVSFNPLHVPASIALAEFDMIAGSAENALKRLKPFLGKVSPAGTWREKAISYTQGLFHLQIREAGKEMADGRYLDALNRLKILEAFCTGLEVWNCPSALFQTMQQAHQGMYNSYLSVAHRAFHSLNYSFTEMYAQNAHAYQQNNITYLPDDSEVIRILTLVYNDYIKNTFDARLRNEYPVAENFVTRAMELCSKYALSTCRQDMLAQSLEEIRQQKSMPAHEMVPGHKAIVRNLDPALARQMVLDMLSQGHLNAWAGRTDEARANLNLVKEYARGYHLRHDTVVNIRIISLNDMIHEKQCELNSRKLHNLWNSLQSHLGQKNYVEANNARQSALEIDRTSENCSFKNEFQLSDMAWLNDAAFYQQLIQEAQREYFRSGQDDYSHFFEKYLEAERFYIQKQLKSNGIEHTSLQSFAENTPNNSLRKEVVLFFSRQDMHNEALHLLFVMKNEGTPARDVRSVQEQAGKMASHYYNRTQPGINPSAYSKQLTRQDKWFNFYVASFAKNWP